MTLKEYLDSVKPDIAAGRFEEVFTEMWTKLINFEIDTVGYNDAFKNVLNELADSSDLNDLINKLSITSQKTRLYGYPLAGYNIKQNSIKVPVIRGSILGKARFKTDVYIEADKISDYNDSMSSPFENTKFDGDLYLKVNQIDVKNSGAVFRNCDGAEKVFLELGSPKHSYLFDNCDDIREITVVSCPDSVSTLITSSRRYNSVKITLPDNVTDISKLTSGQTEINELHLGPNVKTMDIGNIYAEKFFCPAGSLTEETIREVARIRGAFNINIITT